MTTLVVLVVVLSMTLRVPEAAISAYMVFFVTRPSVKMTAVTGLGLTVAAMVAIAVTFLAYSICLDSPALRLPVMFGLTLFGMYFSRVSPLGPIGFAIGFIVTLGLSLADSIGVPELLVRGLLWVGIAVIYPSLLVTFAELAFGEPATVKFAAGLGRWQSQARHCGSGDERLTQTTLARRWLELQIGTAELVELAAGVPKSQRESTHRLVYHLDRELALALVAREFGPMSGPTNVDADVIAAERSDRAEDKAEAASERFSATEVRLLVEDATSNTAYLRFAVKSALSVMLAYMTYTVLGWSSIRTAMITCFFVAGESVGDTLQKLRLRLTGALVGGLLAIATIVWLVPHLDTVLGLVVLTVVGTLPAAWIATASPRIAYAGWQMAIAFYLCTLTGFSPSLDMVAARDRVIGILLGNAIVTWVHQGLWPVPAHVHAKGLLKEVWRDCSRLRELSMASAAGGYRLRQRILGGLVRAAAAVEAVRSERRSVTVSGRHEVHRALLACSQLTLLVVAERALAEPRAESDARDPRLAHAIGRRIAELQLLVTAGDPQPRARAPRVLSNTG